MPSNSPSYSPSSSSAPSDFAVTQQVALERSVLSLLYETAGGQSWRRQQNWNNKTLSVCEWQGIKCNANGLVSEINLKNNGLIGPLVSDVGLMKELHTIEFSKNNLSGTIPSELGTLNNLERLVLFDNDFTGTIPEKSFDDMKKLSILFLSTNHLTGEIPPGVFKAPNLLSLFVHNNKLSGTIPSEIGLSSQLKSFYCFQNSLEGELPDELGNLPVISNLLMHNNSFVGTVDYSSPLCGMSNIVGGSLRKLTLDCRSPDDSSSEPEIVCDCCSSCFCDTCQDFLNPLQ
mmetsp:Transcript_3764/g.5459  ORF Transcript_3764/g.5459 Transcript_3764/m.5459 type:complete len:288 (-) Transcript_3764:1461-2324(-)